MLRKIRLLSLAYLCAENTSVDFSAVATALGVETADVEMWIIDGESWQVVCTVDGIVMAQSLRTSANLPGLILPLARSCAVIRVGLVEAKVDQVNQRVHVNRSKCTKFDQSQWEELRVSHNYSICFHLVFRQSYDKSKKLTLFRFPCHLVAKNRLTGWSKNLAQCQRVMKTVKLQIDEVGARPHKCEPVFVCLSPLAGKG